MAGATLSVSLTDANVKRALQALAVRTVNLEPAFKEFGSYEVTSTQHRIEEEHDPDGKRWPELRPSTQLARRGRSRSIRGGEHMLRVSNLLFQSLTYLASQFELAVGSNRIYAALQQLGGTPDMPPGPAHVPARPYLGLSSDDQEELGIILLEHLGGAVA